MHEHIFALAVVACGLTGCTHQSPNAANARNENMTDKSFMIGGTDFGIDVEESSFELDISNPAKPLLTIEVKGNEELFDKLSEQEGSKWSWALYAPHFYIRDFPAVPGKEIGNFIASASLDDIDEHELAIYMMEHSDIDDVKIEVTGDNAVDVTGRVDLLGETHEFAIRWRR